MLTLPRPVRLLFLSIATLLAVSAAAVVSRLAAEVTAEQPAVAVETAEDDSGAPPTVLRQVTLITTADGRTIAVDPSTPEGQAAIDEAVARGDLVEERTVSIAADDDEPGDRAASEGGRSALLPGTPLSPAALDAVAEQLTQAPPIGDAPVAVTLPPVVQDVVDGAVDAVNEAVNGVTDTVNGVVDDVEGVVNDAIDTVNDVTDGTTVSVPGVPVTVTTPPVTVTAPPVVTTVVTVPPVTVTVPPVTVPPVTLPPVTLPPTTLPPPTVPTTLPPLPGLGG